MSGYVLMTAAFNEETFIAETIQSVLSQTILPLRWIIVSDGSTDRTDAIVNRYASVHSVIRFLRIESAQPRGVVRKVQALTVAHQHLQDLNYRILGNLDADVSLPACYYERLMQRFESNAQLGIAGGAIYEKRKEVFEPRRSNNLRSVAHAAQVVRRECYEDIGGYHALKYGGEDWYAEVNALMKGWKVESFADLVVMHHKRTGAADRPFIHRFRQGRMDYAVGSHPAFELFKCARRVPERPFGLGALTRLLGFCYSCAKKEPREVSPEFVQFLREEHRKRLKAVLHGASDPLPTTDHG